MKERGFELVANLPCPKEEFLMPKRGDYRSAGYDIFLNSDEEIKVYPQRVSPIIRLGIKVYMKADEMLMIYPRSSTGFKLNLQLVNTTGMIDASYYDNPDNEGEICLQLYNFGTELRTLKRGDRLIQGVFMKYLTTDNDMVLQGERLGGIGSTGK